MHRFSVTSFPRGPGRAGLVLAFTEAGLCSLSSDKRRIRGKGCPLVPILAQPRPWLRVGTTFSIPGDGWLLGADVAHTASAQKSRLV